MVRALGFHYQPGTSLYALIQKEEGSPPEILAAGGVAANDLQDLYTRWADDTRLLWGIAVQKDGHRPSTLPLDWELTQPATHALSHPAMSAGIWEWENGRYGENDLLLWLRPEEILWCEGEPGVRSSGRLPRKGPIRESWSQLFNRLSRRPNSVCLAVDAQAPGAEILEEAVRLDGFEFVLLTPPSQEQSADRAALGAALTALNPVRTGVIEPRPAKRKKDPTAWGLLFLAIAALSASSFLAHNQRIESIPAPAASTADSNHSPPPPPPQPIPNSLNRWIQRRETFLQTLEATLEAAPTDSIRSFEILSSTEATAAQVRLLLSSDQVPDLRSGILELRPSSARPGLWTGDSASRGKE